MAAFNPESLPEPREPSSPGSPGRACFPILLFGGSVRWLPQQTIMEKNMINLLFLSSLPLIQIYSGLLQQ